jgi:Protein of unknown function (DUF2726)
MSHYVVLAVVVVLIVLAIGKGAGARRARGPKLVPKTLFTRNEKLFMELLVRSLPDHYVFPQVSMGALMQVTGGEKDSNMRLRNRFSRKIVDYVVADHNLDVVALVELDDASHRTKVRADAQRHGMTDEAG